LERAPQEQTVGIFGDAREACEIAGWFPAMIIEKAKACVGPFSKYTALSKAYRPNSVDKPALLVQ